MALGQKFYNINYKDSLKKNRDLKSIEKVHLRIVSDYKNGKLECLSIIEDSDDLNRIKSIAEKFKNYDNVLIIGTGGSSLGGKTLVSLKRNHFIDNKKPKFFFIENIDHNPLTELMQTIDLKKTAIIVISKSGETIETLCQFFFVREFFKKKNISLVKKTLVITEEKQSTLKKIQESSKFIFLKHSSKIGGRYSIFSSVGLIPAYLANINIKDLRKGAFLVLQEMFKVKKIQNFSPAVSALNNSHLMKKGINQCVLMPYSDSLYNFAVWFRQLWAESIGKNGQGSTPINSIGTIDQHSQLQLYLDGPRNKFIHIIGVEKNNSFKLNCKTKDFLFEKLHNKRMNELLDAEKEATFQTFRKKGIPTRMINLKNTNEKTIGSLLMHFILETIYTCYFLDVDPFNQPAVEEGKKLALKFLKNEKN
tara:strand:+ start:2209 stop:3471 length:1263 start_codon:yes stop_codon:yes gene_type:complete